MKELAESVSGIKLLIKRNEWKGPRKKRKKRKNEEIKKEKI